MQNLAQKRIQFLYSYNPLREKFSGLSSVYEMINATNARTSPTLELPPEGQEEEASLVIVVTTTAV